MISSVFGKTKPINYIILLSVLFITYWTVNLYLYEQDYSCVDWIWKTVALGFLMFTLFVVNFVVKRNQITAPNAYAILFFTLFIIFFPEVLRDTNAIFSGFFLALAFRRTVSLRSLKNVKLKLFDASLWIVIASVFCDWALLFLVLVFISIYMYEPKNVRNWLVPIVATATVLLVLYAILILADNTAFLEQHYSFTVQGNPNLLFPEPHGIKLLIYVVLILFTGIYGIAKIGKLGLGRILSMRLVVGFFLIGLVVTLLETTSDAFPVFVTFFPGAALITKYVETIKRAKLREVVLVLGVMLPLVTWIIQHVAK